MVTKVSVIECWLQLIHKHSHIIVSVLLSHKETSYADHMLQAPLLDCAPVIANMFYVLSFMYFMGVVGWCEGAG